VDGACHDTYAGSHPVVDFFGTNQGVWTPTHMNDPGINQQAGTVASGGEFTGCVTPEGVHDLHGNLHEWTADADGIFRGGFFADAVLNGPGCTYRTTAHSRGYHDYSTGFRCCSSR
jgi:formylglycine-generating enzyme required for sulfatase activity